MGVPGSNLLEEAFECIDTLEVLYYPNTGRDKNSVGQWIAVYGPAVSYQASVQAVDRRSYLELGLDLNKRYLMIYMSADANDFKRGTSGDKVEFEGTTLQIESNLDWFRMDGWVGLLGIEIQP